MSEVDYKKFIQSTKVNKNIIKQKKVSKFQTLHSTKKNNLENENRNKFSEDKFLQTYVDTTVERKKASSKKKKMSLLEGQIATKMEIKKYIEWSGVYKWTGLNLEQRKEKLIYDIKKTHYEEYMIDDEFIYPRGIDYVQKVILFTHRRIQYLDLTGVDIQKEYERMDLVWTIEWAKRFSQNDYLKFHFFDDLNFVTYEISLKQFLNICNKRPKEFYKIKNNAGELFGKKRGTERVLTYVECNYILKNYWCKSYTRILSISISEIDLELLQKEYEFIKHEKKLKTRTPNTNQTANSSNLINVSELNLKQSRLSKLKKYIYKNHPSQKELFYDSKTNSYYITRDMYQWYKQIYCSSTTDYELFQKDFQYYREYIRRKNIYLQNNLIAIDNYKTIKKIWRCTEIEYECYLSLFEYKYGKKNLTSYEYEETFKELMLRHIIFIKNEHEKNTSSQSKKRKTLYTKIENLTFLGIYDGYVENLKAINNHIEVYVHTSYSENLEFIKINLNLDSIKREDKKMLMQFLAKGVSIRFEVSQDKKSGTGVLKSFTIRQVLQFDREEKNGKLEYRCII